MINKTLYTKYGTARINKNGYYWITSCKEGNKGKYLHRLIWEDFYGKPIPEGYVIHHEDFNKLNNHPTNLSCMSNEDHAYLHNGGGSYSDEYKLEKSKSMNTTGYFRVIKYKDKRLKQGFTWRYQYNEDGKQKSIVSVDIKKLEAKVKAKGLKWKKLKGGDE